ncbi:MAG: hypothetical protein DCC67_20215 [Planctomycetota bacterium]|nr:MAG: hypothetical protein DCC67_20215 [Planctomycetota bacterium]
MPFSSVKPVLKQLAGVLVAVNVRAVRASLLAAALVSYGAVPSTPTVQSEFETLQELASSHSEPGHGARLRRASTRLGDKFTARTPTAGSAINRWKRPLLSKLHLSAGLVLPLRC